jgi:hypothetical protein
LLIFSGWIFIQCTTLNAEGVNHDPKLNTKARNFFSAVHENTNRLVGNKYFVFASLYPFNVSDKTKKKMQHSTDIILQAGDFASSLYPFNLLLKGDLLSDPNEALKLIHQFRSLSTTGLKCYLQFLKFS